MVGATPPQPIDCGIAIDSSTCAGKTAIITGGASGLGEAYVRALDSVRATVIIADMDDKMGERLANELNGAKFIQCDVTKWEDQTRLFREARKFSPSGKIHFVVANAGIAGKDDIFEPHDSDEPTEPNLKIIDVNLRGALYTIKQALHYFVRQNGVQQSPNQDDTCLILIGSGAAYFDVPRGAQYSSTKWAMRGVLHAMRSVLPHCGSRVNMIAPWFVGPWYVRTKILSKEAFDHVRETGVQFAELEDGGQCLLRLLSDPSINGRCLFLSARKWASVGYMDLDLDEYPGNSLLAEIQADQIKGSPPELGLFASSTNR